MLTEAIAEVGATAETAVGGNLCDGAIWLVYQQVGCILQTQLQYILVELEIIAALREYGAHSLLR